MYRPTVGLIVPCFGPSYFLKRCVASIVAQVQPFDEVIFVNDDPENRELAEALESTARKLGPSYQVVGHLWNRGILDATKSGLDSASCDYVALLDMDDELLPSAARIVRRAIDDALAEGVSPALLATRRENSAPGHQSLDQNPELIASYRYPMFAALEHTVFSHLKVYRRDFLGSLRFRPELHHMIDWSFGVQSLASNQDVVLIDDVLYRHHIHGKQTSRRHNPRDRFSLNDCRRFHLQELGFGRESLGLRPEVLEAIDEDVRKGAATNTNLVICASSTGDVASFSFHPDLPLHRLTGFPVALIVIAPSTFVDVGVLASQVRMTGDTPIGLSVSSARPESLDVASWAGGLVDFVMAHDYSSALLCLSETATPILVRPLSDDAGALRGRYSPQQIWAAGLWRRLGSVSERLAPRFTWRRQTLRRIFWKLG